MRYQRTDIESGNENRLCGSPQSRAASRQSGCRTLYTEQDRRRDLSKLICAKDDLDRHVALHRRYLGRSDLEEVARISGKIEALKDLIIHTAPCIAETQKFQRETNALQSLVCNQLSAIAVVFPIASATAACHALRHSGTPGLGGLAHRRHP